MKGKFLLKDIKVNKPICIAQSSQRYKVTRNNFL